jgi:hypothetical protein
MDKILSAEEWFKLPINAKNDVLDDVKGYSTYLLEAFAGEVKTKYELQYCNDGKGCGIPYCDQICQEIKPQSIDQLLTNFKEKL